MTHTRAAPSTMEEIAEAIVAGTRGRRALVAIDGGDGSGRTTYAARLANAVGRGGRTAEVIHVDDFMHPRAVRHQRGRTPPEGYLDDSYDYQALSRYVLEPLSAAGDGWFRAGGSGPAARTASATSRSTLRGGTRARAPSRSWRGLFLLRDELVSWWDYSLFLDVDSDIALSRKRRRDGLALSPDTALARRYVEGQRIYRERYRPHEGATWLAASAG